MRAEATDGDEPRLLPGERVTEEELELAHLVAAIERARFVVALDPQLDVPGRRAVEPVNPRREAPERNGRERRMN